jgi:hypothetical protein
MTDPTPPPEPPGADAEMPDADMPDFEFPAFDSRRTRLAIWKGVVRTSLVAAVVLLTATLAATLGLQALQR